jgi:hypothetical protein
VSKAARGKAFDAAKGVTGVAVTALRNRGGQGTDQGSDQGTGQTSGGSTGDTGDTQDASLSTAQPTGAPAEDTLDSAGSDDGSTTEATAVSGPDVDLLPYPQLEDPIPVVEETLAAEAENGSPAGGHATEPHASTRDEDHGDAQLQRAEQEEIAEEVVEAMPGGDLDLETPVGTTGAQVGYNPDTAEADLQQPGTAPGVEPGLTSTVRKDEERGLSAASGTDEVSG